jgi:hypothetical protein
MFNIKILPVNHLYLWSFMLCYYNTSTGTQCFGSAFITCGSGSESRLLDECGSGSNSSSGSQFRPQIFFMYGTGTIPGKMTKFKIFIQTSLLKILYSFITDPMRIRIRNTTGTVHFWKLRIRMRIRIRVFLNLVRSQQKLKDMHLQEIPGTGTRYPIMIDKVTWVDNLQW